MLILVTGSGGLIGSEVCNFFHSQNYKIIGIDNNQRKKFFGNGGSVTWQIKFLKEKLNNYNHLSIDIRQKRSI